VREIKPAKGGEMTIKNRWMVVMFFLTATLCLVAANGCSEKKTQEKMVENIIEQSTGKDVDVKVEKDNIKITGKDSATVIAETSSWPSGLTKDIPKFTAGKIERVVKTQEKGDTWSFNIYLRDFSSDEIKSYENLLKKNGWQTSTMQMGDKGGFLNGQKGTMGINFTYNLPEKSGMLAAFNRPEQG